ANDPDEHDPMAAPVAYRGVVVDSDGKPVSEVVVTSAAAWPGEDTVQRRIVEARAHTDREGCFELTVAGSTEHPLSRQLYFEHPDYGLAWDARTNPDAVYDRHDDEIRIELQPGVEFGGTVVVDEDGQPIAGAVVDTQVDYSDLNRRERKLATTYYGRDVLTERYGRSAVTDAAGRFRLPKLPLGARLSFAVRHPRYVAYGSAGAPVANWIAVEEGSFKIELKPAVTIRGSLLADGKPLAQGGVRVLAIDRNRGGLAARANTDDEGRFEFTGLDEIEHVLYTDAFAANGTELIAEPVVVEQHAAGRSASAELVCTAGEVVVGKVADVDDRPVTAFAVSVHGVDVAGAKNAGVGYRVTTDAEGRYRVRVAPGNYGVSVVDWSSGSAQTITHALKVVAGAPPATVDFRARAIRQFVRRLIDDEGRAIAGVFYLGRNPRPTDQGGSFSLVARPPRIPPAARFRALPGFLTTFCCAVNRDKTLARVLAWSGAEADLPEEIIVSPPAKIVGRLVGGDARKLAAEDFSVGLREPGSNFAGQHLVRDLWQLTLQEDGAFELTVPIGLSLTLQLGLTAGADPPRRRGEFNRWQPLVQLDDLKPGETRDVGDVKR
ncbi:MAG TPA: carboxypeptidase-like regulatory domain-containing protein, partial [Pirellulales bacterium]|nr:carboxypeptidase-like regulatory domain-containing protein [Pirellulales bacterium]